MKCWICGDDASSREHLTKASDVRAIFGHVTQKSPILKHSALLRNEPVPGIDSAKLKHRIPICSNCNNARTQPHDRAWEAFSRYLLKHAPTPNSWLHLSDVFPGQVRASMLNVHLYFLKLLGCQILDHDVPMDIEIFSNSILTCCAHPHVHIVLRVATDKKFKRYIGSGRVDCYQTDSGHVVMARWGYQVGHYMMEVNYLDPSIVRPHSLRWAWHPSTVSRRLRVTGA